MFKLYGKSAPNPNQLEHAVEDGFNAIEIQLLPDFLKRPMIDFYGDIISTNGLDVVSIHTPLLPDRDLECEDLSDSKARLPILKTFYLADMLARHYDRRMNVVVHCASTMADLNYHSDTLYNIARSLEGAFELFPNVDLCIENTIPIISHGKQYSTKNNFLFDNTEVCRFLRDNTSRNRVFTVLDICHALITLQFLQGTEYTTDAVYNLEDFFARNADYCKIIHFNNKIGSGVKPGEHSTPFLEEDEVLLRQIYNAYMKHTPDALCVMEMNESDYTNAPNANKLKTIEALDNLKIPYARMKK